MQEQRLTGRLMQHWDAVRKDRLLPEMHSFYTSAIEDVWRQCFVLELQQGKYKYQYIGDAVSAIYGRDLTGQEVGEGKRFPGAIMLKTVKEVTAEGRPKENNGYFMNEKGELVKYRACFLPFGHDKKGLTHIAVGLSFRVF